MQMIVRNEILGRDSIILLWKPVGKLHYVVSIVPRLSLHPHAQDAIFFSFVA